MGSDPKQAETREKVTLGRRDKHWGLRPGNRFQWRLPKDRPYSNRNSVWPVDKSEDRGRKEPGWKPKLLCIKPTQISNRPLLPTDRVTPSRLQLLLHHRKDRSRSLTLAHLTAWGNKNQLTSSKHKGIQSQGYAHFSFKGQRRIILGFSGQEATSRILYRYLHNHLKCNQLQR